MSNQTAVLTSKKVIAVGSHSYNKGYDLLLKSWQNVAKNSPDWQLHIYGKIDDNQTFIRLCEDLGLSSVYFHEPVANIQEKYLNSSIFVLSSRTEGFGMVIIEAMACGLPCVSFDCPSGPADIISDGEDGFLVENGDIEQLSEKMIILIKNVDLRRKMGQLARQNVKRFEAETIIKSWECLFSTLLR